MARVAGGTRSDVVAKLGKPNASQGEGAAREDVRAFYPDGVKSTFSSRKSRLLLGELYRTTHSVNGDRRVK
jgi:hypothetical protein